jgi:putative transposase
LEQAIEKRQPEPGLVHHSDRGLQYASAEYAAILAPVNLIWPLSIFSFGPALLVNLS